MAELHAVNESVVSQTKNALKESEAELQMRNRAALERAKQIEEQQRKMNERRREREARRLRRKEERRRRTAGLPPATEEEMSALIAAELPPLDPTPPDVPQSSTPSVSAGDVRSAAPPGLADFGVVQGDTAKVPATTTTTPTATSDPADDDASPPPSVIPPPSATSSPNGIDDSIAAPIEDQGPPSAHDAPPPSPPVASAPHDDDPVSHHVADDDVKEGVVVGGHDDGEDEDEGSGGGGADDVVGGPPGDSHQTAHHDGGDGVGPTIIIDDGGVAEHSTAVDSADKFDPKRRPRVTQSHIGRSGSGRNARLETISKFSSLKGARSLPQGSSGIRAGGGGDDSSDSEKKTVAPIRRRTLMDPKIRSSHSSCDKLQQETYECLYEHEDTWVRIIVPSSNAAKHIKAAMCEKIESETGEKIDLDQYVLVIPGANYFITNETLPVHRLQFMQVCKKCFVYPRLQMVARSKSSRGADGASDPPAEDQWARRIHVELNINRQMIELTGTQLKDILASDSEESIDFRKHMAAVRKSVTKARNAAYEREHGERGEFNTSYLPQYRESEPMPSEVPDKFQIHCTLPNDSRMTKVLVCLPQQTPDQVRAAVYRKLCIVEPSAREKSPEAYVLKVTGYKEYFIGSHPVISYDYLRRRLSKKQRIEFSLLPIEDVDLQIPEISGDSFVDEILLKELKHDKKNSGISDQSSINLFDIKTNFGVTVEMAQYVDKFRDLYNERMALIDKKRVKREGKVEAEANTNLATSYALYVYGGLYHGGHMISTPIETSYTTYRDTPVWNQKLFTSLRYKDIPRATRLCFTLFMRQMDAEPDGRPRNRSEDVALGSINIQLFNYKGALLQGRRRFKLWPEEANPIGTTLENVASSTHPAEIQLMFEQFSTEEDVCFPNPEWPEIVPDKEGPKGVIPSAMRSEFARIARTNPAMPLPDKDRLLLWDNRVNACNFPELLPRFLESTQWNRRRCVEEAYRLMAMWKAPRPFDALQLLDAKYASPVVRAYAVACIEDLTDRECADFLLQLAQVLKYEPYHDSPLALFLLRRALFNKNQIGHAFFWHLKAEMHNPIVASKYALLSEAYLRGCGNHRNELAKQNMVMDNLTQIANKIKDVSSSVRLDVLRESLRKMRLPEGGFTLPLDPRLEVKGLLVEKCKYMDSKKLPLWLVFENACRTGAPVFVIFKAGDDLRQDVLTLQMIKIMDKLWKSEGLDLRLNAYGCVATGDELGMIEVVLNAATTAGINKEAGGSKAVLVPSTLKDWLKKNNGEEGSPGFRAAVENFLYSCAGYCVATYVLGIGDRHNDNIMMTKKGHLFHIDFGHFLGNMKSKYGIKRERAPFIFGPQFANILGGSRSEEYTKFVDICGQSYNILRKHGNMFINLFMMMLSTGIPELQSEDDLLYLSASLAPNLTDAEAEERFAKLLTVARKTKSVLLNDMIHILAHSK